ncbi:hypothetical protein ASE36_07405 [Rhizobium sp. Root274]|uniref:hypothetical protein n=1 Tax=unclassified Rhizobium TaxID=2613769 RepID=UPI0007159805|nr:MULTISPECIES: hypothetical protein [unclassified Rhizobium]KQW32019.1 hypothetical protein ASC71_07415 [Rhizobium sp. Root1240]KRD33556.1 hypothetical protein ASE36_07405 [Rhizobium sp. Root274]
MKPTSITFGDRTPDPSQALKNWKPLPEDADLSYPEGAHSVVDYRTKINDRVHAAYRFGLSSIPFDFDRYFGANDSLLDVENMLVTAERAEWPADQHMGQLMMYGVLQALAVENQATLQVLRCFGQKHFFCLQAELDAIKELRIAVAGHPSDHNKNNLEVKGCTFLGHRVHGSRTRFAAVTYVNFSKFLQREIDVLALIAKQRLAVNANLCRVWDAISKHGGISANLFSETRQ